VEVSSEIRDGRHRHSQAQLQHQEQVDCGTHGADASMLVPYPLKPFHGQGQSCQKPSDQQALAPMVADMFEAVAALGVVESSVFNFTGALGHEKDGAANDRWRGKTVNQ
jgi:hypothetical protein